MMVAGLTAGREKFADDQDICEKAAAEGRDLFRELTTAVDNDTQAFNQVAAAYRMPKETAEEKEERSRAIRAGNLAATEVPFSVMQQALRGMEIAETLLGHSNPNAASDLGVSVLDLHAAVRGAWLNVKINLPGLRDAEKEDRFRRQGSDICSRSAKIAERVYNETENKL